MSKKIFSILLVVAIVCANKTHAAPGFLANTLVDTPQGYKPVQNLKAGDEVYSNNPETGKLTRTKIAKIKSRMIEKFVRITITPKGSLLTSQDQEFYNGDASDNKKASDLELHQAQYLDKNDMLATIARFEKVSTIEVTNWWLCQAYAYFIELESIHNFYVALKWTDAKTKKPSYVSFLVHDGIKEIGMIETATQAIFSGTSVIAGPGIVSLGVGVGVTTAHALDKVATVMQENPKTTKAIVTIATLGLFGVALMMSHDNASGGYGRCGESGGFGGSSGSYDRLEYEWEQRRLYKQRQARHDFKQQEKKQKASDKRIYRELVELNKQLKQEKERNNSNNNNNNNNDFVITENPPVVQPSQQLPKNDEKSNDIKDKDLKKICAALEGTSPEEIKAIIFNIISTETSEMGSPQALNIVADTATVAAAAGVAWIAKKFASKPDETIDAINKIIDQKLEATNNKESVEFKETTHKDTHKEKIRDGSYVLPPIMTSNTQPSQSEYSQSVISETVSITLENQASTYTEVPYSPSITMNDDTSSIESSQSFSVKNEVAASNVEASNNVKETSKTPPAKQVKGESIHLKSDPRNVFVPTKAQQMQQGITNTNEVLKNIKNPYTSADYERDKTAFIESLSFEQKLAIVQAHIQESKDAEEKRAREEQEKRDNPPKNAWYSASYKKSKNPGEKSPWYSFSFKDNRNSKAVETIKIDSVEVSQNNEQAVIETNPELQSDDRVNNNCNIIEITETPCEETIEQQSIDSAENQKSFSTFDFKLNKKVLENIDAHDKRSKSLTSKIVDLCPRYILGTNSSDADFTSTRDVEPWPNELHSLAEQENKSKAKNNNNSTIIETTATDGIEFIPVHEKDPADNIHSTPIIEHHPADDILVHPIHEQNPSDNILSTPIPDPQLPDVYGIPILETGSMDIYNTKLQSDDEKNENRNNFDPHPSTPVGRKGQKPETRVQDGLRKPTVIQGRTYRYHAVKRMQERGYVPEIIENVIRVGKQSADPIPGRFRFDDLVNRIRVVIEGNDIVTIHDIGADL